MELIPGVWGHVKSLGMWVQVDMISERVTDWKRPSLLASRAVENKAVTNVLVSE